MANMSVDLPHPTHRRPPRTHATQVEIDIVNGHDRPPSVM